MLYTLPFSVAGTFWIYSDSVVITNSPTNLEAVSTFLRELNPDTPQGPHFIFADDCPRLSFERRGETELVIPIDDPSHCAVNVTRGVIMIWQGNDR
ncbi:hypothetical protein [Sigmofec virus UA08Rod_6083]|uniref:Uncharacterized protein n=1 Tax=Sigmofec virus UA08Rod_6083 TaxID=2929451 RepID=A0A976N1A6_9VIRU|nr:hypothetical protein [Sigmofec virus UA08Rod_6083]